MCRYQKGFLIDESTGECEKCFALSLGKKLWSKLSRNK